MSGDVLISARCDLDHCRHYKETLFNFHVYRRPEAYRIITEQKGVAPHRGDGRYGGVDQFHSVSGGLVCSSPPVFGVGRGACASGNPTNFRQILELVWWRLDMALTSTSFVTRPVSAHWKLSQEVAPGNHRPPWSPNAIEVRSAHCRGM